MCWLVIRQLRSISLREETVPAAQRSVNRNLAGAAPEIRKRKNDLLGDIAYSDVGRRYVVCYCVCCVGNHTAVP